jgi:hypothetical protein
MTFLVHTVVTVSNCSTQTKKLCYQSLRIKEEKVMIKTIARRKRIVRRDWTRADVKELRQHSKNKTPVKAISRALKRTPGALRQKARVLEIPLGHRRTKKKRAWIARHFSGKLHHFIGGLLSALVHTRGRSAAIVTEFAAAFYRIIESHVDMAAWTSEEQLAFDISFGIESGP